MACECGKVGDGDECVPDCGVLACPSCYGRRYLLAHDPACPGVGPVCDRTCPVQVPCPDCPPDEPATRSGVPRPRMTDAALVKLLAPLKDPRTVTEAQLTIIVKGLLNGYGWRWSHFPPGKTVRGKWITAGTPGFPDFVAVNRHRVVFLELKTTTGTLRPKQIPWLRDLQAVAAFPGSRVEAWTVHPGQVRHLVELLAENPDHG